MLLFIFKEELQAWQSGRISPLINKLPSKLRYSSQQQNYFVHLLSAPEAAVGDEPIPCAPWLGLRDSPQGNCPKSQFLRSAWLSPWLLTRGCFISRQQWKIEYIYIWGVFFEYLQYPSKFLREQHRTWDIFLGLWLAAGLSQAAQWSSYIPWDCSFPALQVATEAPRAVVSKDLCHLFFTYHQTPWIPAMFYSLGMG